ncbi:hypothetical protein PLICRDRAFT_244589 [Plicaturopsis crispa FD-325 SS-3]|nr:hypothetical protein PLICRDRAFT_244589 [Plicaturopsis crispa FD-325 SS-3]
MLSVALPLKARFTTFQLLLLHHTRPIPQTKLKFSCLDASGPSRHGQYACRCACAAGTMSQCFAVSSQALGAQMPIVAHKPPTRDDMSVTCPDRNFQTRCRSTLVTSLRADKHI